MQNATAAGSSQSNISRFFTFEKTIDDITLMSVKEMIMISKNHKKKIESNHFNCLSKPQIIY